MTIGLQEKSKSVLVEKYVLQFETIHQYMYYRNSVTTTHSGLENPGRAINEQKMEDF